MSIQLLCTIGNLQKIHKQCALPSATKLYEMLKTSGTKAVTPKTLENQNSSYQPVRSAKRWKLDPSDTISQMVLRIANSTHKCKLTFYNVCIILLGYATHFNAAQLIESLTAKSTCESIRTLWQLFSLGNKK